MLFGKIDTSKFKLNIRLGGFILVLSFLVIGILVIIFELNKDVKKIEEDIYKNNEIISNDIMMQLGIVENFLDSKSGNLKSYIEHGRGAESSNISIETNSTSWIGHMIDIYGDQFYAFGNGEYEYDNNELKKEVELITGLMQNVTMLSRNIDDSSFIYMSNIHKFDVIYPMGTLQQNYEDYSELQEITRKFHFIDSSGDSGSTIKGESLYLWRAVDYLNGTNYIAVALYNLEQLLAYPELTYAEATYLYTDHNSISLKETESTIDLPIQDLYAVDYKLHELAIDDDYYFYRRITDDILYISKTSKSSMQNIAVNNNVTFFVTVLLAFVMLLVSYFYLMKYRRYLELELESNEQEFKKSLYKSRLGHIMNTISEAFVRADSTYTILEINQAAADMLGYRISEMLGQVITDFMAKPIDVKVRKNEGLYNCYEVSLVKKDGSSLYGLVNMSTVIKDNPITKEHYIMISDITPLIEAQQKAEEANRSKSRFIANLSHEIRTPMNATIGYIYLLEQTYLSDIQKKYLEKMDYASNTLLEIIDEILDFSKIEADRITVEEIPFNLHKVLHNAISMFENTAFRKEIQLLSSLDELVPEYVIGDPYRLRQIIINLLSNAFKFTSFGIVSVRVGVIDITESRIEVDEDIETIIRVEIMDTGIGIPDERMNVLFEPFVQADESTTRIYGGTGLGLAICKRLIDLMGGVIFATSDQDKGSTFTIELPLTITDNSIIEFDPESDAHISHGFSDKKILIVEDNPLNQELLVELLRQKGNKVVVANNGKVAEDILTSNHSTLFDLVLMDIQMPVQDGFTTTRFIRQLPKYAKIPIIAVTANADKETQIMLAESGMNDYILKPINASDLYTKISLWK